MSSTPTDPRPSTHGGREDTPTTTPSVPLGSGHQHAEHTGPMRPAPDTAHLRHGRGHGLMMLACCAPMLLIAFALVASGVAGAGAVFYALFCTAMMAAMMFAMPGHRH